MKYLKRTTYIIVLIVLSILTLIEALTLQIILAIKYGLDQAKYNKRYKIRDCITDYIKTVVYMYILLLNGFLNLWKKA